MKFTKTESGEAFATCLNCGRLYDLNSEWDVANLDWHECIKLGGK